MITAVGSLGTATETSTDRSTSCAISRSVSVGAVVVAWLAVDSTFSVFTPTNGQGYWYATDTAGNIYSTIASFTDDRSFHGSGAQIIIAISQVRTAMTTADSVIFSAAAGLEVGFAYVRCISVEEFDFAGARWAVSGANYAGRSDDAMQPASIGLTFNTSREWLLLHGLGIEGPSTDSFTWDSDYTQIVPIGTNSGTPTDDITLRGGYRIATLSTDSVEVNDDTNSTRDTSQVFVGVCAVTQKTGFPVTGILDAFNRADESPLSAAAGWDDATATTFFGSRAQLITNRAAGSGGSFWNTTMSDCVEVYAQMPVVDEAALTLHGRGDANTATLDGNTVAYVQHSQDARLNIEVGRSGLQGMVGSWLLKAWPTTFSANNWIGFQRSLGPAGSVGVNHIWLDLGGGWEEIAAYVLDSGDGQGEYTTGKLALTVAGSTTRMDNFGGGEYPCRTGRPKVMRYS